MQFQVVNVTPAMAKEWLSNNGKNRKVSAPHVRRLAVSMAGGHWVLNGQTISFDDSGRLLDGQHRLTAVVESGVTVPMAVAVGVSDPEAFKSYDGTALKRGAHQVAQMMGVKSPNEVTAGARVVMCWEESKNTKHFGSLLKAGLREVRHDALADKAQEIEPEYHHAYSILNKSLMRASGAGTLLVAMVVIFNRVDPVATASFCKKISNGVFDSSDDPCLQLRDRIISGRRSIKPHDWKLLLAALTIKSFNYHKKGLPLKMLRWRTEGANPEPFPAISGAPK